MEEIRESSSSAARLLGVLAIACFAFAAPSLAASTEPAGITGAIPKPIKSDPPAYPRGALATGIEGSVNLEFSIDPNGNVVDPRVIQATPPGVFDAAALDALSKWKYQPRGTELANMQVKIVFKQQ